MRVKEVTFNKHITVALPNYENLKLGASVTIQLDELDTVEDTLDQAEHEVNQQLRLSLQNANITDFKRYGL